jgi:hypothetical protein
MVELTPAMRDDQDKVKSVDCSVFREADYKPGPWLLSDRHSKVQLFYENVDAMVSWIKDRDLPFLENLPFLILVREPRLGEHRSMYAKPCSDANFAFGGNWLWSEDPKFPADHPIPIHDALIPDVQ